MEASESTSAIRRAIRLSPERRIQVKVGVLWTAGTSLAACLVICTVYVVRMESKVDRSLEGVQEISEQLKVMHPQHAIMWDHFNRSAAVRPPAPIGP